MASQQIEIIETPGEEVEDFSNYCRLCLQLPDDTELLNLHVIYDEEEQLTYSNCFTLCTQIDLLEGDGVPHNLCKACGLELQMAYDFHKKVEFSKQFFKELLEQQMQSVEIQSVAEEQNYEEKGEVLENPETETAVECEIVEHLDMDEYQEIEELEDAETVQVSIDSKSDEGAYSVYVTDGLRDLKEEEIEYSIDDNSSWQQFVVTMAKEAHLPLETGEPDKTVAQFSTTPETSGFSESCNVKSEFLTYQFSCDYCEKVFPDRSSMLLHQSTHETQSPKYPCLVCGRVFDTKPAVDLHTRTEHKKPEVVISSTDNIVTNRKRFTGKFSCDYCQKVFPNHSRMLLHRRSHEPNRPKYPCFECGRMYATKQAMEVHTRTVHTKSGFVCTICNKIYAIKKCLEVHMRYHTGDFPYVCDLCGKRFAQMCNLTTHKNVKHNSLRFSCEHPNCGKFFTSSASLRNHEFTHGVMPFECEFCNKGYPAKSKLKVHIRRKHGVEMTLEQLEHMRRFHVMRSKLNLVKVVETTGS